MCDVASSDMNLQGCPKWRNEYGKQPVDGFRPTIRAVGMPEADPVYGVDGPLMQLWHRENLARL